MANWYRRDAKKGCLVLTVHIQPGARATRVVGPHAEALKIQINVAPIEGQANAALVKYLGRAFKVPAAQVIVKQGSQGRHKVVEVYDSIVEPETLWANG